MDGNSKENSCKYEQKEHEDSKLQCESTKEAEPGTADVEAKAQTEPDTQVIQAEAIFPDSESKDKSEDLQRLKQKRNKVHEVASAIEEEAEGNEGSSTATLPRLHLLQVNKLSPIQDVTDKTNEPDEMPQECSSSFNLPINDPLGSDVEFLEGKKLSTDQLSNIETSSENAISHSVSQPIAIPSTSRDSADVEPEKNSPKRPTNFEPYVKQSIHIFHPRDQKSVLKKLPVPYLRGHVYLRDSPESSDYGGSPDSLDDPFMMEALCSLENKEEENRDMSEALELSPHTCMDPEESSQPPTSNPIQGNEDLPGVSGNVEDFADLPWIRI